MKGIAPNVLQICDGRVFYHPFLYVTYDIPAGKYQDNGAIFYTDGQRPLYVNSIAVGLDGTVYTLARITENGVTRTDLISIAGPMKNQD